VADGRIAHDGRPPRPEGDCARPGHEHVHPHAAGAAAGPLTGWQGEAS
ncbi:MAG: ABC transporter ATP-binding protein, partial [Nonomuraea sp.]|nr:ABC transporter ATP-binding protein [Nonomuraea sp.]